MMFSDSFARRKTLVVAVASLAVLSSRFAHVKAADAPKKYTVKEVMQKANKGDKNSLFAHVVGGTASDADKALLAEFYAALAADDAPKGDAKDWKDRTEAMAAASKAVAGGDESAIKTLKTASDCKGCHMLHRPPKK